MPRLQACWYWQSYVVLCLVKDEYSPITCFLDLDLNCPKPRQHLCPTFILYVFLLRIPSLLSQIVRPLVLSPTNVLIKNDQLAKPHLWVIELHNGQDSRLTATLVNKGLRPSLDIVEKHWRERWRKAWDVGDKEGGRGALIIVGRRDQDKFFSNGNCNLFMARGQPTSV